MSDIFIKKAAWFDFANKHNKSADSGAVTLNGSDSYTAAALHVAAGIAIPVSIRLDTARTKGVADHFSGLRRYYESGIESKRWLHTLVEQFRQFAAEHSLDSDELIRKIIELTDRRGPGVGLLRNDEISRISDLGQNNSYLPDRDDFESAYRCIARVGEDVELDAVLAQIEIHVVKSGQSLAANWRMLTENNIQIWSTKR